jgi:hypothetical protein
MKEKKKPRGRPKVQSERVMVSRRFNRAIWERFQAYVEGVSPRTTDTAVLELAMQEFLDRKEFLFIPPLPQIPPAEGQG